MAEASRFRRRSKSTSGSAEAGVEDSVGVFEAVGSLDIALVVKQLSGPIQSMRMAEGHGPN
jgi:hypothetical protein